MPSSQKTSFAGLNQWIGSDKPKRIDWNSDNEKIDNALQLQSQNMANHTKDTSLHVSKAEKELWGSPSTCNIETYTGTGTTYQVVKLNNPAKFGVIFKDQDAFVTGGGSGYQNGGFFTDSGCSNGIEKNGSQLTVYQSSSASPEGVKLNLNQHGSSYIIVYW